MDEFLVGGGGAVLARNASVAKPNQLETETGRHCVRLARLSGHRRDGRMSKKKRERRGN